jgi:hypothetical protein
MPELVCPRCEARATTDGSGVQMTVPDGSFERRGKVRRSPVFRCRSCGATLIVRRRLLSGATAYEVDPDTAAMMNIAWTDHVASASIVHSELRRRAREEERRVEALAAGGVECLDCGKVLRSGAGLEAHTAAVHGQP